MQEGGAAQRTGIRQRLGALGRVENQLNAAVFDRVYDMGTPFRDLVDLLRRDSLGVEIARRAAGCADPKAEAQQKLHAFDHTRLIHVADRDENGPARRDFCAASELTFGKGDLEGAVET